MTTKRRQFLKRPASQPVLQPQPHLPPGLRSPRNRSVAHADLCRRGAWRVCDQTLRRRLQQGGQRRDGDRTVLCRPDRPDRRIVPRHAAGTIDAVQSDDDSMASPTEVGLFGGYFPFASRSILDVPVLFNQYGLAKSGDAEYGRSASSTSRQPVQDPCNFNTKEEITQPRRPRRAALYTFPTAGRFLAQFGVVPVTMP
jgi:hypothetical protein